jgi:hypothetical protein
MTATVGAVTERVSKGTRDWLERDRHELGIGDRP